MNSICPIILCGGSGTRLWPMSRETMPKQFIVIEGNHSPFQQTVLRVADPTIYGRPVIVAAETHRFEIERQLAEIQIGATVLLEPARRDSGPAIVAGCLLAAAERPNELVAILACDHAIGDDVAFSESMMLAREGALAGSIVTFGMQPSHAATGYGYIEPGEEILPDIRAVRRFTEKPDAETATRYMAGGYLWNSGNLLARPETILSEFSRLHPASFDAVSRAYAGAGTTLGARLLARADYADAMPISIDYAVLEKTRLAAVVPCDWRWSDIGTWESLWEISRRDARGNVCSGETENLDSDNCYVRSRGPITSLVGCKDLVVVVEPDAVLVADRRNSAQVKKLVEDMSRRRVAQATTHARVHRPWGWYEVRDIGENFQVKRIAVYPSGRLSLQSHRFRAEHWVVVTGTARVTVDETVRILGPNEHAEIPLGAIHRLENPGNTLLEIVEVQHGTYLGEDDIVRIEDVYDRVLEVAE